MNLDKRMSNFSIIANEMTITFIDNVSGEVNKYDRSKNTVTITPDEVRFTPIAPTLQDPILKSLIDGGIDKHYDSYFTMFHMMRPDLTIEELQKQLILSFKASKVGFVTLFPYIDDNAFDYAISQIEIKMKADITNPDRIAASTTCGVEELKKILKPRGPDCLVCIPDAESPAGVPACRPDVECPAGLIGSAGLKLCHSDTFCIPDRPIGPTGHIGPTGS